MNNNNPNSWLYYSGYSPESPIVDYKLWDKYGVSLYWALTTIVTVGYGDITPRNAEETAVAMLTMCI